LEGRVGMEISNSEEFWFFRDSRCKRVTLLTEGIIHGGNRIVKTSIEHSEASPPGNSSGSGSAEGARSQQIELSEWHLTIHETQLLAWFGLRDYT
jgi:hypothetical protein